MLTNADRGADLPGLSAGRKLHAYRSEPIRLPAMPTEIDTMLAKDLARTAHLVADALLGAPSGAELELDTELGPATVICDDAGADVVLTDRDVTVHVRGGAGEAATSVQPDAGEMDAADVQRWARQLSEDALDALAAVDRGPAPDRVVERMADLHEAAVGLRDAADAETSDR